MIAELLLACFFILLLVFVMWALFGLVMTPVFGKNMITLLFAGADAKDLEGRVRSYGWLLEEKTGGRLVIVDCGLTAQGLEIAQKLRKERQWLDYCPYQALPDYIELLQHCLENREELL